MVTTDDESADDDSEESPGDEANSCDDASRCSRRQEEELHLFVRRDGAVGDAFRGTTRFGELLLKAVIGGVRCDNIKTVSIMAKGIVAVFAIMPCRKNGAVFLSMSEANYPLAVERILAMHQRLHQFSRQIVSK